MRLKAELLNGAQPAKVVYLDPNTYGLKGYSFIAPLLLFYDKVVLYGPVAEYINQCYEHQKYHETSLHIDEFTRLITAGRIIPLGFESFFNPAARETLSKPQLRVTSQFDKDLLNINSSLGKAAFRIPDRFKIEESPQVAKELLDSDPSLRNRILSKLDGNKKLPVRYLDFVKDQAPVPLGLKKLVRHKSHAEIIPYLALYDLFNNKYVMACHKEAEVHIQYFDFLDLYEALHGLTDTSLLFADSDIRIARSEVTDLIHEALRLCASAIQYGRLTYEEIEFFHAHLRNDFLQGMKSIMQKVQHLPSPLDRQEAFTNLLADKIQQLRARVEIDFSYVPLFSHLGGCN